MPKKSGKAKRSFRTYYAKAKSRKKIRSNIAVIPTALEAGGVILGLSEILNGNTTDGLVLGGVGIVGGWAVDKIGRKTSLGRAKMGISRKHTVSII